MNKMSNMYLLIKDDCVCQIVVLNNMRDVTPTTFEADSNWQRYLRHEPRSYVFEGDESFTPIPFQQITKDVGYANAYVETHVAYNAIHDEIAQLEEYKSHLESDIRSLKRDYNQGVADLKEYEKWYEAVTEFDKKSYDVWCQMMHDQAFAFMNLEEECD
jgi:hypothetical protein